MSEDDSGVMPTQSPLLRAYLLCEQACEVLDEAGQLRFCDDLIDTMDPMWDALTQAERDWLNAREPSDGEPA